MADLVNDITILVSGDELKKFVSVSVGRSLDALAGAFTFSIARDDFDSKIIPNDIVKIYIDGSLELTGSVKKIVSSYDSESHNITISGFSQTYGLTKATLFFNPNYSTPITFFDLAQKIIDQNEIHDVDVTATKASQKVIVINDGDENRVAGDIGETAFSFLDRFAKREGVILTDAPDGSLVIYENEPIASNIKIRNKKGRLDNKLIKSAEYTIDYENRFKEVLIISQNEDQERISAFSRDELVESEGIMTILSENVVDIEGCKRQANWEINKRRTDSIQYNCKVFGFSFKDQGVWRKNTLVDVDDDFAGIKSQMIIQSVQFNFNDSDGSTTNLTLTIPDAYGQEVESTNAYNAIFGDSERILGIR